MPGTVGFIGLGDMGGPMALNLVKRGFSLVVHDIDPGEGRAAGAARGADGGGVARGRGGRGRSDDLHGGDHRAGRGGHRAASAASSTGRGPGHIVACMSTIDPFVARRLGEQLAARGIAMLDAPVSGGTERAASGELSIIAGGAAETFAACHDLFRAMGTNVFHVGGLGPGAGHEAREQHAGPGQHGRRGRGARARA